MVEKPGFQEDSLIAPAEEFPDSPVPEACLAYQRGREALENRAFEAAIRCFRETLERDPAYLGAWHDLGMAHYRLEQWKAAAEAFERGLELAPGAANLRFKKGMCRLREGRVQEAVEILEQAAAAGLLEAHFQLGLISAQPAQRQRRQRQRAIQHFEAILGGVDEGQEYEGLDRVCLALGGLYGEEPDTHPQAIEVYRRGLAINPLAPLAHDRLGVLLMQRGQTLGALGEFKVAIQLDPAFRAPYTHLAHLFLHHVEPADLAQEYEHIAEEFGAQAPQILARLSLELVEQGREQTYESLYTKGHQLKNLMGIAGSRLRGLVRRARGTVSWEEELAGLAAEQERFYKEWVGFLGAMKPEKVHPGIVEPARLVRKVAEVVKSQAGQVRLQVRVGRIGKKGVRVSSLR